VKRRQVVPRIAREEAERALCRALLALREEREVGDFLRDLCTPAELEALCDRWQVVPLLLAGLPYRDIHDRTGVSVTTIGRVARFLTGGYGGYRLAAARLGLPGSGEGSGGQ
jgi:TrpR-related protein YerC/YecD